ncbi:MAG: hypothetical protein ACREUU_11200, partial [Gammaproteobacteria bacterium]
MLIITQVRDTISRRHRPPGLDTHGRIITMGYFWFKRGFNSRYLNEMAALRALGSFGKNAISWKISAPGPGARAFVPGLIQNHGVHPVARAAGRFCICGSVRREHSARTGAPHIRCWTASIAFKSPGPSKSSTPFSRSGTVLLPDRIKQWVPAAAVIIKG